MRPHTGVQRAVARSPLGRGGGPRDRRVAPVGDQESLKQRRGFRDRLGSRQVEALSKLDATGRQELALLLGLDALDHEH